MDDDYEVFSRYIIFPGREETLLYSCLERNQTKPFLSLEKRRLAWLCFVCLEPQDDVFMVLTSVLISLIKLLFVGVAL